MEGKNSPEVSRLTIMENEKKIPEIRKEVVVKRRYKWGENGQLISALVESKDPAVKSEYYVLKEISIGPQNTKKSVHIAFESMEAVDNDELMHLLHNKKRS